MTKLEKPFSEYMTYFHELSDEYMTKYNAMNPDDNPETGKQFLEIVFPEFKKNVGALLINYSRKHSFITSETKKLITYNRRHVVDFQNKIMERSQVKKKIV